MLLITKKRKKRSTVYIATDEPETPAIPTKPIPLAPTQHKPSFVWLLYMRFHLWKSKYRYLGRYSIEKLQSFEQYQRQTSRWRVALVICGGPLPVYLLIVMIATIPLQSPLVHDLTKQIGFLTSSVLAHSCLALGFLMCLRQALAIDPHALSFKRMLVIAVFQALTLELVMSGLVAHVWRFPVPFREILGLIPWSLLLVLYNFLFARHALQKHVKLLVYYCNNMGGQLTLFFCFLALSLGISYLPIALQVVLVLLFPIQKILMKHQVWKFARILPDLSTDVTICLVEISGALYQTVCTQYVQSGYVVLLILATDLIQAATEVAMYLTHKFVVDGRSTVQTAIRIIDAALYPAAASVDLPPQPQSQTKPAHVKSTVIRRRSSFFRGFFGRSSSSSRSRRSSGLISFSTPVDRRHLEFIRRQSSKKLTLADVHVRSEASQSRHEASLSHASSRTNSKQDLKPPLERPRLLSQRSTTVVVIDNITIPRRDQARILEETLQLLFSCEALLFIEYMEVLMPLLYAMLIGTLWHLPSAQYNLLLHDMTKEQMLSTVRSCVAYAALESLSLMAMTWLMQRKYGISIWYQLAFVLEHYWLTLQGKLIACFMTIVQLAMMHQGTDFTFRFDLSKVLSQTPASV